MTAQLGFDLTGKRWYPQLVNAKRGESRWCRGEEGRPHVGKHDPEPDGRVLCRHCDKVCGRWAADNGFG